jgi:hypothetical protein
MTVSELVRALQGLPDQEATVIVACDAISEWLIASAILQRRISRSDRNSDIVVPGTEIAIEIV